MIQAIYDANKGIIKVDMDKFGSSLLVSSEDGFARLYGWNRMKKEFYLSREWFIGENDPNFAISMNVFSQVLLIAGKGEVKIFQSCLSAIFNCVICSNIRVC
jgi:hypothetical protein